MIGGAIGALALAPFAIGLIADYAALSGALVAYAVSTLVCAGMTFTANEDPFDFDVIARAMSTARPSPSEERTHPMSVAALTFYVLIWPVLVAIILTVICVGFFREFRAAKKQGRDIV